MNQTNALNHRHRFEFRAALACLLASVWTVALAVMRLRLLQSSEQRFTNADDASQSHREKRFRREEGRFQNTRNLAGVKTPMLWPSLLASVLLVLVVTSEARGQLRSRLGNPSIFVQIEHPPELPLIAEKIVFGPAVGECSNEVVSALMDHFVDKGLEVIDWENLDLIFADHDFSFSGYVDQRSAAEMGKILGPSTLLVVRVTRCATDWQRFESSVTRKDPKTDEKHKVTVYHAKTLVLLELSLQTADLTTGRLFDARSIMHSPSLQNQSEDGYPEIPSEFEVQDITFARVVGDVSRMLFPRVEKKSLIFFDNKQCNLKAAHQALKRGEEERALDLSLENLETCKNNPDPKKKQKKRQKILANAHYNVGVMHRIRGNLDVALEHLMEAEQLRPVEIMAEAIADCREAIQARDAMQGIREQTQQAGLKFQERQAAEEQVGRENTLTNSGVIALVKIGLSEAIILKKIETSMCEFDVSAEALVSLTEAGVGEKVILYMMEFQQSDNGR